MLIAEEAGVPNTQVEILAVTEYTPQRTRRSRRLRATVVVAHRGLGDAQVQVDFQIRVPPSSEVDDQETSTYTSGMSAGAIVGLIVGVAAVVGMVAGVVVVFVVMPRMRESSRDSTEQTLDTDTVSYPDNMGSPKGIEMMATVSTATHEQQQQLAPTAPLGPRTRSANMDNDGGKPNESVAAGMIAVAVDEALKAEEAIQIDGRNTYTDAEAGAPEGGVVDTSAAAAAAVGMVRDVVEEALERQLAGDEERRGAEEFGSAEVDMEAEADAAASAVVASVFDKRVPALPQSPAMATANDATASSDTGEGEGRPRVHQAPPKPKRTGSTHKLSASKLDAHKVSVIVSVADGEGDDDATLAI